MNVENKGAIWELLFYVPGTFVQRSGYKLFYNGGLHEWAIGNNDGNVIEHSPNYGIIVEQWLVLTGISDKWALLNIF